jgi:hypothetical protein
MAQPLHPTTARPKTQAAVVMSFFMASPVFLFDAY